MAITTSMPPQAYTRDTLVKAIDWISRQPVAMKERASSADMIVSHYLQACRRADLQMDAPVSGETFREDLKHLAEDLKQFDVPFAPPPIVPPLRREPPVAPVARHFVEEQLPDPAPLTFAPVYAPPHSVPQPAPSAAQPKVFTWQPDARTLTMAREIQQRLNLGSESEGLRLLITLGSERARELFP